MFLKFCSSLKLNLLALFVSVAITSFIPLSTAAITNIGTSYITATIPTLVKVSRLQDMDLGTTTINPDGSPRSIDGKVHYCIYSNAPNGAYGITIFSAYGTGSIARMRHGFNTLTYSIVHSTGGSPTDMIPGIKKTGFYGHSTSTTCGGTTNEWTGASVTASNIAGATAGTYSDTLTILIEP
ncbi:MAG: hypothetical protein ACTSXQ_01195 [Alphaproteobacteria bacterium]